MRQDHLVLVDGNNVTMRSYHAMYQSKLTAPDGTPSGAVYGNIAALRSYMRELAPTHMAWLFDGGRSDFRTNLRAEYKGHRKQAVVDAAKPNPAEDLPPQYEAFERFLDALGIRHYRETGVEADDLIAQLVIRNREQDGMITIISGDHDMLQLVSDRHQIRVLRPGVASSTKGLMGLSIGQLMNEAEVEHKYKTKVEYLAAMWALTGDTGDNIIGIPKVGPVTAAKWVNKWSGQLEDIVLREPKCAGYERKVLQNRQLIELKGDLGNVPFAYHDMAISSPTDRRWREAVEILVQWDMRSIVESIDRREFAA